MADAFSMLAVVLVGLFFGVNLDKYFKTAPLFTIIGVFWGIATGILSAWKKTKYK